MTISKALLAVISKETPTVLEAAIGVMAKALQVQFAEGLLSGVSWTYAPDGHQTGISASEEFESPFEDDHWVKHLERSHLCFAIEFERRPAGKKAALCLAWVWRRGWCHLIRGRVEDGWSNLRDYTFYWDAAAGHYRPFDANPTGTCH